jgi:HEPN domain-containing protein
VLVCEQIGFPYTHNLPTLFNLIPNEWGAARVEADLERLSEYAVESRYPADLPDITHEEASEATKDAAHLFGAVQHDMKSRLPDASSGK